MLHVRPQRRPALTLTRPVRRVGAHLWLSPVPLSRLPRALFREGLLAKPRPRSARGPRLGFSAATEEATPKELQHQGDDAAEDRHAELQLDELRQRFVHATGTRKRILKWLEQPAHERRPLHAGTREAKDYTHTQGEQGPAVIGLGEFFGHGREYSAARRFWSRNILDLRDPARARAGTACQSSRGAA